MEEAAKCSKCNEVKPICCDQMPPDGSAAYCSDCCDGRAHIPTCRMGHAYCERDHPLED